MKINFVVPQLDTTRFSGGIYCILKHADALTKKGHTINIIPFPYSKKPAWIQCDAHFIFDNNTKLKRARHKLGAGKQFFKSDAYKRAFIEHSITKRIPDADLTIATTWATATIVFQHGKGKRVLFAQHFESIFEPENDIRKFQSADTYRLPMYKVANSRWLKQTIDKYLASQGITETVYRCVNGVDLSIFSNRHNAALDSNEKKIVLISYGGRNVMWKGFQQMAEALALVRKSLPEWKIEWRVYGGAVLPPQNHIAPYIDLGFLQSKELAKAYNEADILFSASWYESFPLFPLEGMACGIATLCGLYGVEDYADHGINAEIVESKDPANIATGLIKLITDKTYRQSISKNGEQTAQQFDWVYANNTLEEALKEIMGQESNLVKRSFSCDEQMKDLLF